MSCPRCGFPGSEPCALCSTNHFDTYEMERHQGNAPSRFEFSLVFPAGKRYEPLLELLDDSVSYRKTDEFAPRYFVFFKDKQNRKIGPFLERSKGLENVFLLVNGRIRPFTEALWLPLLELLSSADENGE